MACPITFFLFKWTCTGHHFTIEHALSCSRDGFPSIRYNEIHNITVDLLSEVCHGVRTEPSLQPVTGEQFEHRTANREEGAWLDIVAQSFWGTDRQSVFFDVRVFNPYAPSYRSSTLPQCYQKNELEKKTAYEECVREIEHGSFSPLVFSATGAWAPSQLLCTRGWPLSWQRNKTIQLDITVAKMQTELFVAEISHNVHSGLTIYLLLRLYIPTYGVHWPGPSWRPGASIWTSSLLLLFFNSLSQLNSYFSFYTCTHSLE